MAKIWFSRQLNFLWTWSCIHALSRYTHKAILGWIVYDISENASTKMDEDLAK